MPAATPVAHHKVTLVALFAQAALVALPDVGVEALLAQPLSVLVPVALRQRSDGAELGGAVLASDAIFAVPGMGRHRDQLRLAAGQVHCLVAHLTDYHVCLVFAGLALFAYLAVRAVPAEAFNQISLQFGLDAPAVPVVLAGLTLDGVVGIGDCCNSLVTDLASADPVVGLCYRALSLRLPCGHFLGLRGAVTCLGRLLRLLLRRGSRLHRSDRVLDVLHDLLELGRWIYHARDQRLATLRAEADRLVALHHLKAKSSNSSGISLTLHGCPLFDSNIWVLQ